MDATLDSIDGGSTPVTHAPTIGTRTEDASSLSSDLTWLPSVQRWLPGSWADAPIADKAVKSDDAEVNVHSWHQRIMLLNPCTAATLAVLARFATRWWRRRLIHSFFASYLRRRYGGAWATFLRQSREVVPALASPLPAKCQRGPLGARCDVKGVEPSSSTKHDGTLALRIELNKDLRQGLLLVLGQTMRSTW